MCPPFPVPDVQELYQNIIREHLRAPRHVTPLVDATHRATVRNTVCGDVVEVAFNVVGERIAAASFAGEGCALSRAGASLLLDHLVGRTMEELPPILATVQEITTQEAPLPEGPEWGELTALAGVRAFPARQRCALLAVEATRAALSLPEGED